MIGKRFRSLPFIFANDNYTLRTTTVLKQRPHVKIQDIKKTYVLNILVIEQFLLDNIKKGISDVFLQKEGYCGVQRENY